MLNGRSKTDLEKRIPFLLSTFLNECKFLKYDYVYMHYSRGEKKINENKLNKINAKNK